MPQTCTKFVAENACAEFKVSSQNDRPQLALAKDKVNPEQHTCVTHRCPQLSLAKDKFISALLKCGVLVYSP